MATVTQCDTCRKTTDPGKRDEWFEIRYSRDKIANFFGIKNKRYEICGECFDGILAELRQKINK